MGRVVYAMLWRKKKQRLENFCLSLFLNIAVLHGKIIFELEIM